MLSISYPSSRLMTHKVSVSSAPSAFVKGKRSFDRSVMVSCLISRGCTHGIGPAHSRAAHRLPLIDERRQQGGGRDTASVNEHGDGSTSYRGIPAGQPGHVRVTLSMGHGGCSSLSPAPSEERHAV